MAQTAFIKVGPVKCPRCGVLADLVEKDALVGLDDIERVKSGLPSEFPRNIYGCKTCTTPVYGIGQLSEQFDPDPDAPGFGVSYKPFTFLSDGTEVF